MSPVLEIRTHITTGRQTVVTDMGDEIDVVSFIAEVAKQDFGLVTQGIAERFGISTSAGRVVN